MRKSLKPWSKLVVVQFDSRLLLFRSYGWKNIPFQFQPVSFDEFCWSNPFWDFVGVSDTVIVYLMISIGLMGPFGSFRWSLDGITREQVTPTCTELDAQDALELRLERAFLKVQNLLFFISLGRLGPKSWGGWVACSLLVWLVAWLVGSRKSRPLFSDAVGLYCVHCVAWYRF